MTIARSLARDAGAGLLRHAGAALRDRLNAVWPWFRRERDLQHVMRLDDHLLRDIGLTRDELLRHRDQIFRQLSFPPPLVAVGSGSPLAASVRLGSFDLVIDSNRLFL